MGWKWTFYLNGCLTLAVTIFWMILIIDTPSESNRISADELQFILQNIITEKPDEEVVPKVPPYWDIITSIKVWSVVIRKMNLTSLFNARVISGCI